MDLPCGVAADEFAALMGENRAERLGILDREGIERRALGVPEADGFIFAGADDEGAVGAE